MILRKRERVSSVSSLLIRFSKEVNELPGIGEKLARESLAEQIVESCRRVEFVYSIKERRISPRRKNPEDDLFDPIRAAILHDMEGNKDEAFWLIFLSTHFGKHRKTEWLLVRDVYGCMGQGRVWTWDNVSSNVSGFRNWLSENETVIKNKIPHGAFGNHRKYESLKGDTDNGTGAVVESYVNWVGAPFSHVGMINSISGDMNSCPKATFDFLYNSMEAVRRFGRTARFDYLTMLSKVGLAEIEPSTPYLSGATGPLNGAKLLLGCNRTDKIHMHEMEERLVELGEYIGVGMQVIEDALCNWQKSPKQFKPFRG